MTGASDPLERVRASFGKQGLMRLLGAEVVEAGPGICVIEVPFRDELIQQESYFHGAVTGAIADTAGGYAALTLAPPDREVLTVEYKVNFLAPAAARSSWPAERSSPPAAASSSAGPRSSPQPAGRA